MEISCIGSIIFEVLKDCNANVPILFFAVYINHRPAFGLSPEKLIKAFETLGLPTDKGFAIERGDLLDLMQTKGKHMCQLMKSWYTVKPV